SLIYFLLRGELTTRFILKVLTILLVALGVFVYYLWEARRSQGSVKPWYIALVSWASIVIVATAIIYGFFLVGSPSEERAYRFDDERVSNLQMIQNEIINFWQTKKRLPNDLAELTDEIKGFRAPKDPETGADYVYKKTGDENFDLCATFVRPNRSRASEPKISVPGQEFTWEHNEGEQCFSRTVDPERYPFFEKTR
ncbi:hypothetical protein HYT00_01710, partial [Candidatus Giovannonibacteria bacterium]|nr:hypothetical protein [Candidatus Giovannonibacteria bacterium]